MSAKWGVGVFEIGFAYIINKVITGQIFGRVETFVLFIVGGKQDAVTCWCAYGDVVYDVSSILKLG